MTISISAVALVVSIAAIVLSASQSRREAERGTRMQLTDVLSKISATAMERTKVVHETSGASDQTYQRALTDALDGQQDFLLQQAKYLIDQIPHLVTSVELTNLAGTFFNRGDVMRAEDFYKQAIGAAPRGHYTLIATVAYAEFLFWQRKWGDGRKAFEDAVASISKPTSDIDYYDRGWAYERWGWSEQAAASNEPNERQRFTQAKAEYLSISDPDFRKSRVNDLESMQASLNPSPAPSPAS